MIDTYGLEQNFKIKFDIILLEDVRTEIFTSSTLDKSEETVEKRLYRIYTIIDSMERNQKVYYLIKNDKGIVGWVNLIDSIVLYNKENKPVKVFNQDFDKIEINTKINIELGLMDTSKIYTSKYFVMNKDDIFEVLMEKDKIRGIMNPKDLDHSIKVSKKIITNKKYVIDSKIELYRESGLKNKVIEEVVNPTVVVTDYFEKLQIARIILKRKRYWLKLDLLEKDNLPPKIDRLVTSQEVMFGHIASSFSNEQETSKKVIKKLLNENKELINIIDNYNSDQTPGKSEEFKELEKKYENLKKSKLGKLQVAYWNFRKKRRI